MVFYSLGRKDFICLAEILPSMADKIGMSPHNQRTTSYIGKISIEAANSFWDEVSPSIEWARRSSVAAQLLNMALHDINKNQATVLEYDEVMGFPVQTETARTECIELLTQASSWGDRRLDNICTHFRNAKTLGDNSLYDPLPETDIVETSKSIRLMNIGFNRNELIELLNSNNISHNLEDKYLEFPEAYVSLSSKLCNQPTREEICMWIFEGKKDGGLQAYVKNVNTDELIPFPSTAWMTKTKLDDCVNDLRRFYFNNNEIQEFTPRTRWITGKELFNRWCFSVGLEKTEQLINDNLITAWDDSNETRLIGFNPGIALPLPDESIKPVLKHDSLFSLTAIEEIEKRESISSDLTEENVYFDFHLNLKLEPDNWKDWLNELGLSIDEAKNISKSLLKGNQTQIDSLNAASQLAALDCKAKLHIENIDIILKSSLQKPDLFNDRVRLYVWRFIIKKSFFSNPDTEFKVNRNQTFKSKIEEIDRLLTTDHLIVECDKNHLNYNNFVNNWVESGLDKHLSHFEIAQLWASPVGDNEIVKRYEMKIYQAIEDAELIAEVSLRNTKAIGGFEIIPYSPTILRESKNGFINGGWLKFTIHCKNFKAWLKNTNQWPLPEDCLLNKWFDLEPEIKAEENSIDLLVLNNQPVNIDDHSLTKPQNRQHHLKISLWNIALNLAAETGCQPHEELKQICYPILQWIQICSSYYQEMIDWTYYPDELKELKRTYEANKYPFLETRFDIKKADEIQALMMDIANGEKRLVFSQPEFDFLNSIDVYKYDYQSFANRASLELPEFWFSNLLNKECIEINAQTISKLQTVDPTIIDNISHNPEPQPEALADDGKINDGKSKSINQVDSVFEQIDNLYSKEIALMIMKNNLIKILIRKKEYQVSSEQLGFTHDSNYWKLLEGSAVHQGDLKPSIKKLYSHKDLEKNKKNMKTQVSRLRKMLKTKMGIVDNPIPNRSYKFAFKSMLHEEIHTKNFTKNDDAMDYIDTNSFDENQHSKTDFWNEDE